MSRLALLLSATLVAFAASAAAPPFPIFDAHLHYNDDAQAPFPVEGVLKRLRESGVTGVLATSRPNDGTKALVAAVARSPAAIRVVPFLRPYRTRADRATWFDDPSIFAMLEADLAGGIAWRGIGEFHLDGREAESPGVRRIVALAGEHGLWLHAHCDEAALETLLGLDPRARIIWAHTGFGTPPAKVAAYLDRHPNLVGELSYRGGITEGGRLTAEWRALFLRHPDRFLIGSDTWVNDRWTRYGEIIGEYRGWLDQLPAAVAAAIAHRNAERLFGDPK